MAAKVSARDRKELDVTLPKPYYQDDAVTLYNADCRELLPLLGKFDLLLTDPPYGINWNTNYSRFSKGFVNKSPIACDSLGDFKIDYFIEICDEAIVFGCNCLTHNKPGSYLIWDKRCADGFSFLSDGEAAWWSEGRGVYIKSINAQQFRQKAGLHPTQKPVELMTWCISKAKKSQTILDPFAGSGSTLVAAKLEQRKAVGIELEKEYCEIAAKRLSQQLLF